MLACQTTPRQRQDQWAMESHFVWGGSYFNRSGAPGVGGKKGWRCSGGVSNETFRPARALAPVISLTQRNHNLRSTLFANAPSHSE